ncbi:hypothetical protein QR98_0072180 [Sarcoptes scabiei]|uniref:Uncharacterized protein n=1 Tax=Sarcoptes scabiei TaxID=52283 RepID=A0A132ACH5_SARSC|nr:hypothetical protein QR98_0072180 [Sarcoptes scabiei]
MAVRMGNQKKKIGNEVPGSNHMERQQQQQQQCCQDNLFKVFSSSNCYKIMLDDSFNEIWNEIGEKN